MINILVSGASGIVGYGILKSLRSSGKDLGLIGTTIYQDSVAQGFCDAFELALPTSDPTYIDWLCQIIQKHNVKLIIPGIEADMYKWAENVLRIEETGTKILLNTPKLLEFCIDKWAFYDHLKKYDTGLDIESSLGSDFNTLQTQLGLPFILKPRRGFGSKGIVKVTDEKTFYKHREFIGPSLMAQMFVGDDEEEYTVSSFCDGKGSYVALMSMKRKLSNDGFTNKAEVVFPPNIANAVTALCEIYKPIGPTNFQFRVHNGQLKLLEINPRISSSTSIRTAFGYNESLMSVEYFLEGIEPVQPEIRLGRAVRYTEDFIFYH